MRCKITISCKGEYEKINIYKLLLYFILSGMVNSFLTGVFKSRHKSELSFLPEEIFHQFTAFFSQNSFSNFCTWMQHR